MLELITSSTFVSSLGLQSQRRLQQVTHIRSENVEVFDEILGLTLHGYSLKGAGKLSAI